MPTPIEPRAVDHNFEEYNQVYIQASKPVSLYVAVLLTMFGLMALTWAIPFPHIAFLGRYNGYLNWASFLIAGIIYYHLKLSPMVSYAILFLLFGFSYGIIQLEQWEKAGGPHLWLLSLIILLIGLAGQIVAFKASATRNNYFKLLTQSSTWLLVTLLKIIKIKY